MHGKSLSGWGKSWMHLSCTHMIENKNEITGHKKLHTQRKYVSVSFIFHGRARWKNGNRHTTFNLNARNAHPSSEGHSKYHFLF